MSPDNRNDPHLVSESVFLPYDKAVKRLIEALEDDSERVSAKDVLAGVLLEEACERALSTLQELGWIKNHVDQRPPEMRLEYIVALDTAGLVRWFKKLPRVLGRPDFWIRLMNDVEAELDAKNWDARKKKYPNRHGDTWLYFWDNTITTKGQLILGVKDKFLKKWRERCKKVLLISKMDIFNEYAQRQIKTVFDSIATVGFKLTEPADKATIDHIAVELHKAFRTLKPESATETTAKPTEGPS